MAKRNVKDTADAEQMQSQQPEGEVKADPEVSQSQPSEGEVTADLKAAQKPQEFMITCRNRISKLVGGVDFQNGVGYTTDGFTASWFGNKDGYDVSVAER